MTDRARTIRRHVRRAAVYLAIGVATTVAIAWAGVATSELNVFRDKNFVLYPKQVDELLLAVRLQRSERFERWRVMIARKQPVPNAVPRITKSDLPSGVARWIDRTLERNASEWRADLPPILPWVHIDRAGWPMAAMEARWEFSRSYWKSDRPSSLRRIGGLLITDPPITSLTREERVIPFIPILSGFLINTLLFAGALAIPVESLVAIRNFIRRRRRARRGRCPSCNYNFTNLDSDRCPECGAPTPNTAPR